MAPLEWIAAIGTLLAAGMAAADRGRRRTGWGVWQYLLSRKNRRLMERLEPVAKMVELEVELERE